MPSILSSHSLFCLATHSMQSLNKYTNAMHAESCFTNPKNLTKIIKEFESYLSDPSDTKMKLVLAQLYRPKQPYIRLILHSVEQYLPMVKRF